ncbi:MAG: LysR family transcriptional regulator [Clostridia bacterium]|nr:LysR family transcriptional regulator [Clostridia bacterium]
MTLSTCDVLLKIVETGSLARTAEALGYTPSRISQILSAAESELGLLLFHRGRPTLLPTRECEALLPALRELQESETIFSEQLSRLKNLQIGTIRIGAFTSLSCHWLPARLKAFRTRYPGIRFDLRLGHRDQIVDWTRTGIIDVGLMEDPQAPELSFTLLQEDPYVVVVPEQHPLAACESVAYDRLAGEAFLFLEPEDNRAVEEALARDGFFPTVDYRVKDDYTIMAMVECGLGVSILPRLVLNRSPYRICAVPFDPPHLRRIGFVLRKNGRLSPATQRLIAFWRQEQEGSSAPEKGDCT